MKKITTPLDKKQIERLKAGDEVLLSGEIYTARDQAHLRLEDLLKQHRSLPFDLKGAVIYYCGPNPARKGAVIGSCGPTTSKRMDEFTPAMLRAGLSGMIGKGSRAKHVMDSIGKNKAVYFLAYAGCGALITKYIKSKKLIAYKDLGPEAIYQLKVRDLPLIVGADCKGRSIYD
jgi:fumarate hydratase subunit beta